MALKKEGECSNRGGSILAAEFGNQSVHKTCCSRPGSIELLFQPIHQGHQLIDFGDDPALFGKGWERHHDSLQIGSLELACTVGGAFNRLKNCRLKGA